MTRARVEVTHDGHGLISAVLPGADGTERLIPVYDLAALSRILSGIERGETRACADDGAPARLQVEHWVKHGIVPNPRCPHCIAEMRIGTGSRRKSRVTSERVLGEGAVVRHLAAKPSAKRKHSTQTTTTATRLSPEDLGF